ncbi:MAG: hypothetical protein ABIO70_15955, partial [Pseudomonadota bacterium]
GATQRDESTWGAPTAEPPGLEHPPAVAAQPTWGAPAPSVPPSEPPGQEHPPRSWAAPPPSAHPSTPTWGGPTTDWGEPLSAPSPTAEPPGYEDPTELRQVLGGVRAHREPHADDYSSAGGATWGSRVGAGEPSGVPLQIQEKARVVRAVFKRRGGLDGYAPTHATPENGLSWGMFGFNQRTGTLGAVLGAASRRDQEWYADSPIFDQVFGVEEAAELRRFAARETPEARMAPVAQKPLTDPAWTERFQKAGRLHRPAPEGLGIEPARDPFKLAQNEIAVTVFLEGVLPNAAALGFNTDRALAMLLDRAVDVGPAEAARWFGVAMASAPAGASLRDRLVQAASTAPTDGWGERLRSLAVDSADLYDTLFRLDA